MTGGLHILSFVLLIAFGCVGAQQKYADKEQVGLAKLRISVEKFLQDDYTKSDVYLLTWLREKNYDVGASKEAILANLKWRKDNQIDKMLSEDYSQFDKNYPFNIDGTDKEGRPIMIVPAGRWRPRQAVIGGQVDQFSRFMIRTWLEIPFQRVKEEWAKGKNVSQYIIIVDLYGINTREHICLQCGQVYAKLVTAGEKYYPRQSFKTIFINTPRAFDALLAIIRPLMSDYTRQNLVMLDHNRDKWQAQLKEWVERNQLPPRYGGTKAFKDGDYYGHSYEALEKKFN